MNNFNVDYVYSDKVLLKLYRRALEEYRKHFEDSINPKIVFVTDLVTCSQKRVFRRQYPELAFRFEPVFVLGEMVHIGIENVLKDYGFQVEVEIKRDIKVDNEKYTVKGRVDAVNQDIIVEIKTARTDASIPHEHHLMQLQIYLNLLNRNNGVLIYVTPDRIAEIMIKRELISIENLVKETVENTIHPRWDWECKYCIYSKMCPYKQIK